MLNLPLDSCLPGSGWVFEDSGTLDLKGQAEIRKQMWISSAFIRKDGDRQMTYYWFPQRGRVLNNMFELPVLDTILPGAG
ncbi:MAG: hypothetical protein A2W25_09445 [candidate division Zixibacteria bacterium RBG_16_53_22]|nr:MAG: hypothetical protein A2W25_09445 [candidate division Zixibacteria bacterium RBG_16_53_22]